MQNIVSNMCEKFHYDRLRNDRALGNGKSEITTRWPHEEEEEEEEEEEQEQQQQQQQSLRCRGETARRCVMRWFAKNAKTGRNS